MRKGLFFFYLLLCPVFLFAQDKIVDSLTGLLNKHRREDTARVKLLNQLTRQLFFLGSDKAVTVGNEALQLAQKLKYTPGEILAMERLGNYYQALGDYEKALQFFTLEVKAASRIRDSISAAWANVFIGSIHQAQSDYPVALQFYLQSLQIFEKAGNEQDAASVMGNIGVLYQDMSEPETAQKYYEQGLKIQEKDGNDQEIVRFLNNLGGVYKDQQMYQQAEVTFKKCLALAEQLKEKHYIALISRNLMDVKATTKNYAEAFAYGFRSLALYKSLEEMEGIADITFLIGSCYVDINKPDSAIFYAMQSLTLAKKIGFLRNIHSTYNVLANAFAMKRNFTKAYEYLQGFVTYKDSLNGLERKNIMAGMKFKYDLDKKQSQILLLTKENQLKEQAAKDNRIKAYAFFIGLLLVGALAIILIRSNMRKQRDNVLLKAQKEEVQATLTALKAMQSQLIQSEKMASLGELTAGIAHEIQNPLNFVNNFSEVNTELVDELEDEASKGNIEGIKAIAKDLKENEQKINHHGKRADAIVKGMLQHSRASTGKKEPTDINALADEYLRLSYHGMRAKDKSFNAEIKTDFDNSIEKINVVPQDIGRVLLNLFNNAFYALQQKQNLTGLQNLSGLNKYESTVSVCTERIDGKILISVKDNGIGIPQKVVDKIFQPFFTTKPTGQGTGLGLSLSYDIIKAHGGEIKVETKEGEGSEFVIQLPV